MKKILMVAVAVFLGLGAFVIEGGRIAALVQISAGLPMLLGPLVSTAFAFSWSEISQAFTDAFSGRPDGNRLGEYRNGVLVVQSLESSALYWAAVIFILAMIGVLSSIHDASELGPIVALAMVALLMGFSLKTWLFTPMRFSLEKKILAVGHFENDANARTGM